MIKGLESYAHYKTSGEPWLGAVPSHWHVKRMKTLLVERTTKGFPEEPLLAATQTKGVVRKDYYENRTVVAQKDFHLLKLVRQGDFVISLRSFQGGIEYARDQGIISPAYTILYPTHNQHHGYLAHLFKSKPFIESLGLFVTGIRQGQNIDYAKLSRSSIPIPPLEDQTAIVRFLSHVNRQIKRHIRAKRKLVTLLNEQKQVIIHQAVTRGLNSKVRLKPSGVEWLGDVPEHWDVVALRLRYSQCLGKMLDSKRVLGVNSLQYLRNTDVQWGRINTSDLPQMDIAPGEYDRYTIRHGDLLVCEGGEVGRCAIWTSDHQTCGFQKALHRLRPHSTNRDLPRFLFYVLRAATQIGAFIDGHESTIPHLTGDKLRSHRFQFPPLHEQVNIVAHLDMESAAIDKTIESAQHEIDLLLELRTRLISDVVTGKLDVREATAQLPPDEDTEEAFDDVETAVEDDDAGGACEPEEAQE